MSEVLTNEQVAALVEAARQGEIPDKAAAPAGRRARRVREVDFTRPTKFTQEQQRRVRRGHDSFCRSLSTQFSAELRTPVDLEVINIDQQTWSSALVEIPQASLYAVVETSSGTRVLLTLEQAAAMHMLERLLGGTTPPKVTDRDLTEIEVALTRRILDGIVTLLSNTWSEMVATSLSLGAVETQAMTAQLASSSEPTLIVTIEVRIDRLSSTLTLLVPYRSIESALDQLAPGHFGGHVDLAADREAEESLRVALCGVGIEVRAEIGSRELTVEEVLALAPGEVLRLGPAASGTTLYADSVPIHRGKPGRSGRHRAVQIVGRIEP